MSLTLSQLKPKSGSTKSRKRIGRGNGSGMGTYSCRGMNGQRSRKGKKLKSWFEGGQTSFLQRMPQLKGFNNPNHIEYFAINLDLLEKSFKADEKVSSKTLCEKGILKNEHTPFKILGNGTLTKKLHIITNKISNSALKKIESTNSKVEIIPFRKTIKNRTKTTRK